MANKKEYFEICVNGSTQDAFIDSYSESMTDDEGKLIYVDDEKKLIQHQQKVRRVEIMVVDRQDDTKATIIRIPAKDIKKLYAKILEIESETWNAEFD